MKKWLLRLLYAALVMLPIGAIADYTATVGSGTTIFAFVCSTTKVCPATVLIDSTNVEKATAGNPLRTDPTGTTTQPVSAASLPLPTGAGTSANQTSQITQETATAAALGTTGDTAWTSGVGSVIAILKNIANGIAGSIPAGTNIIGTVGQLPYPVGAVPITASATGTTAATTATLAGTTGKTTYICSMSVRANATANTNVTDTITGVITGTLSRALWVPANTAGLGIDEMIYNPCVPASATNTAIAVVSGAPGTGGVVTVNATGYQL